MNSPIRTADYAGRASVKSFVRACAATGIGFAHKVPAAKVAVDAWSQDSGTEWLLRAATTPTAMANAPALTQSLMPDFVATLATQSAAARILREGLQLSFDSASRIVVPTLLGDPAYAAFVAEGGPIPVTQGYVEPVIILTPKKIAAIVVMTQEMLNSSNVEVLMQDALIRSMGMALDLVMFDTNPADDARPAGLRYGIAPLAASGAPDPTAALLLDIETLHSAVAPVSMRQPLFAAGLTRALMADLRSPHGLAPLTMIGSYGLHGSKDVAAIAPQAVVSVFGDAPEISASRADVVLMDTQPPTDGSLAPETQSMWQADSVAIKVKLPVTWGLRAAAGFAWLTAENW